MSPGGHLMVPHKTLLRFVHPVTGKLPQIQTAASNRLGLPSVSLRESPAVKVVVNSLSRRLRLCHRKNIEWFEPSITSYNASIHAILMHVKWSSQMVRIYSQLRHTSYPGALSTAACVRPNGRIAYEKMEVAEGSSIPYFYAHFAI